MSNPHVGAVLLHALADDVVRNAYLREALHHVRLFFEVVVDVPGDVLDAARFVFESRN